MFTTDRTKVVREAVRDTASPVAQRAVEITSPRFASTQHTFALLGMCVVFFLLSVLPHVAFSQEETTETEQIEAVRDTDSLLSLYPSDSIPGGDAVVGDFVVGPGKVDITIEPGQTKITEMTVTNRTGETRLFKISIEDATGSDDVHTPVVLLGDDRGPYSLQDYIYIPHHEFELAQNQRARIPVTITIPEDAEPAGLYGSVLVQTLAGEGQAGNTGGTVPRSPIVARIGTLFFVTVPGKVDHNLELKHFGTITDQKVYQSTPISFGILHENTGSIHAAPYGELRIHNMFNEEVGYLEIDPWFVLPNSVRLREIVWDREILFGRYTATVYINRSYDDIIDEMSYSFWVLPWKPIALGFAGLFIIIFIIKSFFKRFEFKRKI